MSLLSSAVSWDIFKTFKLESVYSVDNWLPITDLVEKSRLAIIPHIRECLELEKKWDDRLHSLCGDHAQYNWSKFRPIRDFREEDWSDWLAWLLESSKTGELAASIFAKHVGWVTNSFASPRVEREFSTDDRRTDILINWGTNAMTSVEVKIWDQQFEKTFETAEKLHKTAPESKWYDFILIPRQSQENWNEVVRSRDCRGLIRVEVIFWDEVVRGLRKCLWNQNEFILWRSWALAFSCVIESKILGSPRVYRSSEKVIPSEYQMILSRLNVLRCDWELKL